MPCTPFTKELVLAILRPTLFNFDEWSYEILELGLEKDLDAADLVESIFRFHPLVLNFLQECPYELISKVYYKQVISGLCMEVGSLPVAAIQTMMRCVINMGLMQIFIESQFIQTQDWEAFVRKLGNIISFQHKLTLFIAVIKNDQLDEKQSTILTNKLFGQKQLTQNQQNQLVDLIDLKLIQFKQGKYLIASKLILIFKMTTLFSGIRLALVERVAQFWESVNLTRIGSMQQ